MSGMMRLDRLLVVELLVFVVCLGALAHVVLGVGKEVVRAHAAQVVFAHALVRELELGLRAR